jgi:hypothetical protein
LISSWLMCMLTYYDFIMFVIRGKQYLQDPFNFMIPINQLGQT